MPQDSILEAVDRRVTFNNETPDTSDVVLCRYCGDSLHAPEQDIFWSETTDHYCVYHQIHDISVERDALQAQIDERDATITDLAQKGTRYITQLEQALATARADALREAAGFHQSQRDRWQKVIDEDDTQRAALNWGPVVANHDAYADAILALIDHPAPATRKSALQEMQGIAEDLDALTPETVAKAALEWAAYAQCRSTFDGQVTHAIPEQLQKKIRAAASDPTTIAAIIAKAGAQF